MDRAAGPPRAAGQRHPVALSGCLVLSVALERRIRPSLLELDLWPPRSDSEVRAVRGIMMASRASGPDASVASLSRGAAGGEARGKPGSAAHWQLAATGI